jgi:hypothetical protein
MENRHEPMVLQHRQMSAKVRGHYASYGIRGTTAVHRILGGRVALVAEPPTLISRVVSDLAPA